MSPVAPLKQRIYRRKGGGGGHGDADGGDSGGDGGGDTGDSGDKGGDSKGEDVPVSGSTDGESDAVAYGAGGGKSVTIPQGQPFAGRTSGGGTRGEVYGTSEYGSGYPDLSAGSVSGRDFPFVFWPVVWRSPGYGAPYLYDPEYGTPWNTSRPGGPLAEATFTSNTANSTFYVIADNSTVTSLITSISKNCSSSIGGASSKVPTPFNATASEPQPEQAIRYYRASSVTLLVDGYNNTDALAPGGGDASATAVPLPGWVDSSLLECLNDTIGEAVPLFSGGAPTRVHVTNFVPILVMGWFMWKFCRDV
ncbi:hypothetical protein EVJ58_g976 [Rhodofomes roseus]|uniref:Uncharacterized protein n=1 Tax=Rhodofomes roseus TaxID=34475 RepID=A0A4Y9Z3F6_9APHY|nr:hypothetical protein EVJ58_g976 [Rhodofomes roseus]